MRHAILILLLTATACETNDLRFTDAAKAAVAAQLGQTGLIFTNLRKSGSKEAKADKLLCGEVSGGRLEATAHFIYDDGVQSVQIEPFDRPEQPIVEQERQAFSQEWSNFCAV